MSRFLEAEWTLDHLPQLSNFTNEEAEPQRNELRFLDHRYGDHYTKEKNQYSNPHSVLPLRPSVLFLAGTDITPLLHQN